MLYTQMQSSRKAWTFVHFEVREMAETAYIGQFLASQEHDGLATAGRMDI